MLIALQLAGVKADVLTFHGQILMALVVSSKVSLLKVVLLLPLVSIVVLFKVREIC